MGYTKDKPVGWGYLYKGKMYCNIRNLPEHVEKEFWCLPSPLPCSSLMKQLPEGVINFYYESGEGCIPLPPKFERIR